MGPAELVLLFVAGIGGGLTGSMAGLASLLSYPALLAAGLPPVTANATNTVALVFNSVGSVTGSRPELTGRLHHVRSLAFVALGGGVAGSVLLLLAPARSFELAVPALIALASLALLLRPRPPDPDGAPATHSLATLAGAGAIAVYGGYFGAAAGVMMLALLLRVTREPLAAANAVKNLVMGLVNLTAAVVFVVTGHVDWVAAAPTALGLFLGGLLGPVVVRHVRPGPLRIAIAVLGLGLAVYLGLDAYR